MAVLRPTTGGDGSTQMYI